MRKKEVLARLLRAGGGFRVATAVRGRSASELHVLAYHRILPAVSDAEYPFDVELISADPEQFDWQMSWLAKNFTPVSVSDVADSLDKGKALPAGAVVVTFDDGYMDNYVHAFPVLKSRGIPACIFLSTEYVGTFRPYWFESVAQVLMSAPAQSVRIPAVDEMLPRAGKRGTRREDIRWVLSVLKRLPDELRRANMAALELQVNGAGDAAARFGAHAMDWT
ncbi:MAG: polysaccharide deacetylase family protein, partial [Burkholderiales bacterium]